MTFVNVKISNGKIANVRNFNRLHSDMTLTNQNAVCLLADIGNEAITLMQDYGLSDVNELRSILQNIEGSR